MNETARFFFFFFSYLKVSWAAGSDVGAVAAGFLFPFPIDYELHKVFWGCIVYAHCAM